MMISTFWISKLIYMFTNMSLDITARTKEPCANKMLDLHLHI